MIRWLHVKNFRSLRDTRVDFTSPLTAIIGANNTGKTSLMQVLDILGMLADRSLVDIFQGGYTPNLVLAQGAAGPMQFSLVVECLDASAGPQRYEYRLALGFPPAGGIQVEEESLASLDSTDNIVQRFLSRQRGQQYWTFLNEVSGKEEEYHGDVSYHAMAQLRDLRAHQSLYRFRLGLAFMRLHDFQPLALKSSSQIARSPVLRWDGGNLPAVLDSLLGESPQDFAAIRADTVRIIPELEGILLKTLDGGSKFVALKERWLPRETASFQASDGVLRSIVMLTAINQAAKPYVVAFEEPENGIHPRRLELLVDCLRRYAQSSPDGVQRQVIITTHSPYLVDKLRPEEILVATRDDKGTRVEPIADLERVGRLLQDAPLGEIWHRGSIGGVPSP